MKTITIKNDKNRLSTEEIDRMVAEAEAFAEQVRRHQLSGPPVSHVTLPQDEEARKRVEGLNTLSNYIFSLKDQVSDSKGLGGKLEQVQKDAIQNIISDTSGWVDDYGSKATAEEINEKLQEIQDVANPIVSSIYHGAQDGKDEDDDWNHTEL
jgi:heat shock protein 5